MLELEASLPSFVLELNIKPPKRVTKTNDGYMKRKYREEKRLDDIYGEISEVKEKEKSRSSNENEEKPLRFLKLIEKPTPRPPTPQMEMPVDEEDEKLDLAVIYLQKIIRGKAIQNMVEFWSNILT